jgi:hypothetical protein
MKTKELTIPITIRVPLRLATLLEGWAAEQRLTIPNFLMENMIRPTARHWEIEDTKHIRELERNVRKINQGKSHTPAQPVEGAGASLGLSWQEQSGVHPHNPDGGLRWAVSEGVSDIAGTESADKATG